MPIQTKTNVVCWRLYPIEPKSGISDPLEYRSPGTAERALSPEDLKARLTYMELVSLARAQPILFHPLLDTLTHRQELWFRLLGGGRSDLGSFVDPRLLSIGDSWSTLEGRPFVPSPFKPVSVDPAAGSPSGELASLGAGNPPSIATLKHELEHAQTREIEPASLERGVEAERIIEETEPQVGGNPDDVVFSWTPEQRLVIEAAANERLLVDAGPGTGKTATACARIAWLIMNGGVEASEIWLFSFTRTAVHELRNRISSYLQNPADVAALRIATIDSYAWTIQSGFDNEASLTGTFDDNIRRVIELVKNHEGVFSYLSDLRHLIVDEAQDVIGPRCELLLEIMHAVPREAGISVFSDDAQAIYAFSESGEATDVEGTLPENIRKFLSEEFKEHDLSRVHRTRDKKLLQVFRDGRAMIRGRGASGGEQLASVLDLLKKTNHGVLGPYWEDIQQLGPNSSDALLLFRSRGAALAASTYMGTNPHRMRMSGLPTCIHGWVAELLWDWIKPEIDAVDFERLWAERLGDATGEHAKQAWSVLVRTFGRTASRVSVSKLVAKLASSSPTYELTMPDFGSSGPVIGTIHGSKGREAGEVRLFLPKQLGDDEREGLDEEARVAFVGATRARSTLLVGEANHRSINVRQSGRAYAPSKKEASAQVEIGRAQDIDAEGLVGRCFYATPEDACQAQARVMVSRGSTVSALAEMTSENLDWRYRLAADSLGGQLCFLSKTVNNDLFFIAKEVGSNVTPPKRWPPSRIKHLRVLGYRTMALSPDNPVRETLHAPWRDSGLIAAPMLLGYSMAYFR